MSNDMSAQPFAPLKPRPQATGRTVMALMLREMSSRYGRSPGGYIWAVLEPLGAIIVLALGFSLLVRAPSLGTSFILFYATGFLPFNLYQTVSVMVARSISFSKPLLFYPSVTWVDAMAARFILNLLTGLMVAYLLLTGILMVVDTRTVLEFTPILMGFGLAALLGLSVGAMNCALLSLFPVWSVVWSIITRPLFLASGVIFIYEDMPIGVQNILWYNPLMHVTGVLRTGFYPMYNPAYVSQVYVVSVSLIVLAGGLMLLRRHNKTIIND